VTLANFSVVRLSIVATSVAVAFGPLPAALAQPVGSETPSICTDLARLASEEDLDEALRQAGGTRSVEQRGGEVLIGRFDFGADGRIESVLENFGHLVLVSDDDLEIEVSPDPAVDWQSDDFRWPDPLGMVTRGDSVYIVWWVGGSLRYVSEITPARMHKVSCQLGQQYEERAGARVYHVLTEYERFESAARNASQKPWAYAFRRTGLEAAELLLANGHSITETVYDEPLLSVAVGQGRDDVVDWLLSHGADANPAGRHQLMERAVQMQRFAMATRLLEAGAELAPMYVIVDSIKSGGDGLDSFMRALVTRLGHVPEPMLQQAARSRVPWLDELTGSGLPIQLFRVEWRDGARSVVPPWVASELAAAPAELRKVADMYERVEPLPTRFAVVTYGTYDQGWGVQRGSESPASDEQLLTFATSVCVYFLDADCGPPELVRSAREWAGSLNLACDDARLAGTLDATACSVAMYYAGVANVVYDQSMLIIPINERTRAPGVRTIDRVDLRAAYIAKRARQ
jgi:hypothetical protein